jgi:small-conductance mechanosensitive channel
MSEVTRWLTDTALGRLVLSLTAVMVVALAIRFAQGVISRSVVDRAARYRGRKSAAFVGYLVAAMIVAAVFVDSLQKIGVALGVAGAGIAFALQEVIASVAGWVAVSVGSFYHVGDRVQLGGIKGDVIDIGVLRTTIMEVGEWVRGDAYTGRIVRVANSFVFKEPVYNYSADFPFLWDEIMIPVRYGSDYRLARKILADAAEEVVGDYSRTAHQAFDRVVRIYSIEQASTEPIVLVTANDNWVEFALRYTVDYRRRRATKDQLFMRILDEIENTSAKVQIASTTVHLVEAPELDVRLSGAPTPRDINPSGSGSCGG